MSTLIVNCRHFMAFASTVTSDNTAPVWHTLAAFYNICPLPLRKHSSDSLGWPVALHTLVAGGVEKLLDVLCILPQLARAFSAGARSADIGFSRPLNVHLNSYVVLSYFGDNWLVPVKISWAPQKPERAGATQAYSAAQCCLLKQVHPEHAHIRSIVRSNAATRLSTCATWCGRPPRHGLGVASVSSPLANSTMDDNGDWIEWGGEEDGYLWWVTGPNELGGWGDTDETPGLGGPNLIAELGVGAPELTAAVLVDAPYVQQVHMVHVRCVDYLCILRCTPLVTHTTMHASANIPLPHMSSSAWPNATAVCLDTLVSTKIFSDVKKWSWPFQHCNMLAPPNHQAVIDADSLLRSALDTTGADVPKLLRALQHARVVRALLDSVQELLDSPIVSRSKATLHDVLGQVIIAMGLGSIETDDAMECSLEIEGQAGSIRYTVSIRNLDGRTHYFTAIKDITIVHNSFDMFESLAQLNKDVEALASSLGYLTTMYALHFKFNTDATGIGMVQAIGLSHLSSLTSIHVEGTLIGGRDGHHTAVPTVVSSVF
ncbi:hypothetical protein PENSPDRAFT_672365 [Peniophora sp. CONT]|nr:hypothetical protein PENSPDRAFT_672365 [Peniophora sp. CONT]